jgi:hypothetical protein
MARIRRFKLQGDSRPFELFGIGWKKDTLKATAEEIRKSGYYARVIPTRFDKDIQAQRYAIFVRQKQGWNNYPQDSAFDGMGMLKHPSTNTLNHLRNSSGRILKHDNRMNFSGRVPPKNAKTWIFNRKNSDAEWDEAIKKNKVTELDRLTAATLGLSLSQTLSRKSEIKHRMKDEWWRKEYRTDPLGKFSGSSLAERAKQLEDNTAERARLAGYGTSGSSADNETSTEIEEEDEMEMLDSVSYNDSAYPLGLSPMVLMGYAGGGVNRTIGEAEYTALLTDAELYKEKAAENAKAFFSGGGRFSKIADLGLAVPEPSWNDVIALPLTTIKYFDIGKHTFNPTVRQVEATPGMITSNDANPFAANTVAAWWLHPKAKDTLFSSANSRTRGNEFAAEASMLEHIFAGGWGYPSFKQSVQWSDELMAERVEEQLLNLELEGPPPEIMVVGTDTGFFNGKGKMLGVRLTPYSDEDILGDDYLSAIEAGQLKEPIFPPFMQSLFPGKAHWDAAGTAQVWWRGNKVWGTSDPTGNGLGFEYTPLDYVVEDLSGLSAAEIAGIYTGSAKTVSPEESAAFLRELKEGDIDDRIRYNEDFHEQLRDRATLSPEQFAVKHLDSYDTLWASP